MVHVGHIRATLRKQSVPQWLQHVEQAPTRLSLRNEKDDFCRELLLAKGEISNLFGPSQKAALAASGKADPVLAKSNVPEALKMYRLLQPENAMPFYKQDALVAMRSKLNKELQLDNSAVVNPRSFLIALETAVSALADDLEAFCFSENIPEKSDPERFLKLTNLIMDAFPLRKDPSYVDQFMIDSWPKLKGLLPPIDETEFADWLRGHLVRVVANQRGSNRDEMYSFSRDFKFDSFSNSPQSSSSASMAQLLTLLGQEPDPSVCESFETFVNDCKKIGLEKWAPDIDKMLDANLPRGPLPQLVDVSEQDIASAKLMLEAAAKGTLNLLDFESVVPPSQMFHASPPEPCLSTNSLPEYLDIDAAVARLTCRPSPATGTALEQVLDSEKKFVKSAGAAEWDNDGWRWKTPAGALFDPRLNRYVRNQTLVDPNLSLSSMRQWTCDVRRMCSMSSAGRIYYSRSIVVVGNGQGIYGFGVGFGNTPRESTADAAVKALRNLKFVDYDPTRTLTTPVRGTEYKARLFLRPLRQGKKLRCGRRFLPLFYILGLHNVRARFNHTGWFPRINAIVRTLDQIQSRKTLANATGKKFADITVPGDHWVHWPDRWFDTIRRTYQNKEQRVKAERRKTLHHKRRNHIVANPSEIRPGWTKDAWMNPLAKWNRQVGRTRTIARTVKELPLSEHFPTGSVQAKALPEQNLVSIE